MGADLRQIRALPGSCWPSLLMVCLCLARRFASRPASIRTGSGPQARC